MAEMKRTCPGLLAASLLALHLLVVSMAMSPTLHHLLHHDADAPDHQCAANLLIDGQIDRPEVAHHPAPRPLLRTVVRLRISASKVPVGYSGALSGERAPPRA